MRIDGTDISGITNLNQHTRNKHVTDMLNKRAAEKLQAQDDSEETKAKAIKLMRSKKPDAEAVLRARDAIVHHDIYYGSVRESIFMNAKRFLTDALVGSQRAAEFELLARDDSIMEEKREVYSEAAEYLNDYISYDFISRHLRSTFRYIPEENTKEIKEQIEIYNAENKIATAMIEDFVMDYLGLSNLDQISAPERVDALKGAIDKLATISGGFIQGFSDDDISPKDLKLYYFRPTPLYIGIGSMMSLEIPMRYALRATEILKKLERIYSEEEAKAWTELGWKQDDNQNWRNAEREAELQRSSENWYRNLTDAEREAQSAIWHRDI